MELLALSLGQGGPLGRLAPSPTGRLHLGHAWAFLLAWWQARALGGRVVLRLEDLDDARASAEHTDGVLRDLEWLGLDWDGAPQFQSEGRARLADGVAQLVARGLAYPCTCTRADLRAVAAPHAGEHEPRYPGTCRDRWSSLAEARRVSGRDAGVRFRVPAGAVTLRDGVLGRFSVDVQAQVGDFLVARRDGTPAYQWAVVADDAAAGVTHVLRGADLLGSTPRQWHLQRALGAPHPAWWHVPLITDTGGARLAKRSDALALAALRERGVDARAVVGWAARAAGLAVPRHLAAREVLPVFRLDRLPGGPVVVDAALVERLASG